MCQFCLFLNCSLKDFREMSSNLDSVHVDQTYQDPNPVSSNSHKPASSQRSKDVSKFVNRMTLVVDDPMFIELVVVIVVIVAAVVSSELGIHVGKSFA